MEFYIPSSIRLHFLECAVVLLYGFLRYIFDFDRFSDTIHVFLWEDNIKMDPQEVGGACGDWMELTHDRDRWRVLVSTVMNLRVLKMRGIS